MKKLDFQVLNNLPAYCPEVWTFPTVGVERLLREHASYVSMLFIVGRKSWGFRVYWNVKR